MDSHPEYKFITIAGHYSTPQGTIKAIRSHAIRTAIQRGPAEIGVNTAHASRDIIKCKAQLKGRFRVIEPSSSRAKLQVDDTAPAGPSILSYSPADVVTSRCIATRALRVQTLGSSDADPFNTLPIPSNSSVDSLVKYFTTRFNLNSTTTDTQRPWFPYAMQNALIMRVTLALAAEFLAATMPYPDANLHREGYKQKGEAMRMIRSRLSSRQSALGASGDLSVLAGVAMLASVEAFQGHFAAAEVHLTGLDALMEARGGPHTIQHDYILCRCINWIDIQVASGLGRVPKFPMLHTLDQVSLPSTIQSPAMTPALRHLDRLGGHSSDGNREAREIFITLKQAICSQREGLAADTIRIVMNAADTSILRFLFVQRRTATPVQKRFLVVVSAAHVFLYAVLREIPTTGHMVQKLVLRMRAALQDADSMALIWISHDAVLLWVLFVGVVGSGTADDRQWFRSRLCQVLHEARDLMTPESCGRDELKRQLSSLLWVDKYCDAALDQVWDHWKTTSM